MNASMSALPEGHQHPSSRPVIRPWQMRTGLSTTSEPKGSLDEWPLFLNGQESRMSCAWMSLGSAR